MSLVRNTMAGIRNYRRFAPYAQRAGRVIGRIAKNYYNARNPRPQRRRMSTTSSGTLKRNYTKRRKVAKGCKKVEKCIKNYLAKDTPTGHYYKEITATTLGASSVQNINRVSDQLFRNIGTAVTKLHFFKVDQLIGAASVLFNSKAASIDDAAALGNFDNKALKFNIQHAHAVVTFKNLTTTDIDFKLYVATHRHGSNTTMTEEWDASLLNINVSGTRPTKSSILTHPTQTKQMQHNYKIQTIKRVLKPGQTLSTRVSMPKNFEFDALKYYLGSTFEKFQTFSKELVYSWKATTGMASFANGASEVPGHYTLANVVDPPAGIACNVKIQYTIDCPRDTTPSSKEDIYAFYDYKTLDDTSINPSGQPQAVTNINPSQFTKQTTLASLV